MMDVSVSRSSSPSRSPRVSRPVSTNQTTSPTMQPSHGPERSVSPALHQTTARGASPFKRVNRPPPAQSASRAQPASARSRSNPSASTTSQSPRAGPTSSQDLSRSLPVGFSSSEIRQPVGSPRSFRSPARAVALTDPSSPSAAASAEEPEAQSLLRRPHRESTSMRNEKQLSEDSRTSHAVTSSLSSSREEDWSTTPIADEQASGVHDVFRQVITTLESQVTSLRREKDMAMDAAKNDRQLFERLQKEQERQLREAERQRSEAQQVATEANAARQRAQDALEQVQRADADIVRSLQAEKAAMRRELERLRDEVAALNLTASNATATAANAPAPAHATATAAAAVAATSTAAATTTMTTTVSPISHAKSGTDDEIHAVKSAASAAAAAGGQDAVLRMLQQSTAARIEAEERLEELRSSLGEQLRVAAEQRDRALAELAAARGRPGSTPVVQQGAVASANHQEKSSLSSQLTAAQREAAESKSVITLLSLAAASERAALNKTIEALETEAASMTSRLREAERSRDDLIEQLGQTAADRQFCMELIMELKAKVADPIASDRASLIHRM